MHRLHFSYSASLLLRETLYWKIEFIKPLAACAVLNWTWNRVIFLTACTCDALSFAHRVDIVDSHSRKPREVDYSSFERTLTTR